jgi:purine-binding chemotaxis protein CheW
VKDAVVDVDDPHMSADSATGVEIRRLVVFRLGEQRYALPIDVVQEIQQIVEPAAIPDSSPSLVGMIDLRGTVVPLVDLRTLLGMERREYELRTPMIICAATDGLVAFAIDDVEDVADIAEDCLQEPSGVYELAERMIGVCRLEEGLVYVLDVERLIPEAGVVDVLREASGDAGE